MFKIYPDLISNIHIKYNEYIKCTYLIQNIHSLKRILCNDSTNISDTILTLIIKNSYFNILNKYDIFYYIINFDNINLMKTYIKCNHHLNYKYTIYKSVLCDSPNLIKMLLNYKFEYTSKYDRNIFDCLIHSTCDFNIALLLLRDGRFDPTLNKDLIIEICDMNIDLTDILEELLTWKSDYVPLKNKKIKFIDKIPLMMRYSAGRGNIKIFKLLLSLSKNYIDVQNISLYTIGLCNKNSIEIIKLFLQKPKYKKELNLSYLFNYSIKHDNLQIVKLLIETEYIPFIDYYDDMYLSLTNGKTEIVKILLKYDKVDPSSFNNKLVKYAFHYGYTEIVEILLNDIRVKKLDVNNHIYVSKSIKFFKTIY